MSDRERDREKRRRRRGRRRKRRTTTTKQLNVISYKLAYCVICIIAVCNKLKYFLYAKKGKRKTEEQTNKGRDCGRDSKYVSM